MSWWLYVLISVCIEVSCFRYLNALSHLCGLWMFFQKHIKIYGLKYLLICGITQMSSLWTWYIIPFMFYKVYKTPQSNPTDQKELSGIH